MKTLYQFFEENGFLINKEALDFNQKKSDGQTPLMVAVSMDDVEIVLQLKKLGQGKLNINAVRSKDGYSAFMLAVEKRHLAIVMEFLDMPELEINKQNNLGETALYIAAKEGFTEIIQEILENKLHAVIDMIAKNNKTALDIATEKKFFGIILHIRKSNIKVSLEAQKVGSEAQKTISPPLNSRMPGNAQYLDKINPEAMKNGLLVFMSSQKKSDSREYDIYKKQFEEWAFSVNAEQKTIRENNLFNDSLVPHQSINLEQTKKFLSHLIVLWKDSVTEYYKIKNLISCSMVMRNISQSVDSFATALNNVGEKNLEDLDSSIEKLNDNVIQNLIAMQVIIQVNIEQFEWIGPKISPDHILYKEFRDFIKQCELEQRKIEEDYYGEFDKVVTLSSKQKEIICYIDSLTLELSLDRKRYSDWITECNIKRKEAILERKRCHDHMMLLLKQIRLGLSPKQHSNLFAKIEKKIGELTELREDILCGTTGFDLPPVVFKTQDYADEKWIELKIIWANRAKSIYLEHLIKLFNYHKKALDEQLQFFLEQTKFLNDYCLDSALKKNIISTNFLQNCPAIFSLDSLFPRGILFKSFIKKNQLQKMQVEDKLESLCLKIESTEDEIQDLQKDILKLTASVEGLEEKIKLTKTTIDKLLATKKSIEESLMMFSSTPNDFSDLYAANDSTVDNLRTKIDDIDFCITSAEENAENVSGFQCSRKMLCNQLEHAVKKSADIGQDISCLEKDYYEAHDQLEALISELDAEKNDLEEIQSKKSAAEKLNCELEHELDVQSKIYFQLCIINQRALLKKDLLNLSPYYCDQDYDENDDDSELESQKIKIQSLIEDVSKAMTGCMIDAFEETWSGQKQTSNETPEINNMDIFLKKLQNIESFFLKQIQGVLEKAQINENYIRVKINEVKAESDLFRTFFKGEKINSTKISLSAQ